MHLISEANVFVRDVWDNVGVDTQASRVKLGRHDSSDLDTDWMFTPWSTAVPRRSPSEYVSCHHRAVCNHTLQLVSDTTTLFHYGVQTAVRAVLRIFFVLRKVAEGLRLDCGQYGSFAVFAVYLRFPAALCGCRTAAWTAYVRKGYW